MRLLVAVNRLPLNGTASGAESESHCCLRCIGTLSQNCRDALKSAGHVSLTRASAAVARVEPSHNLPNIARVACHGQQRCHQQ